MKTAKILCAAGILALASTPLLAQDLQLKMGGAGGQKLEVAPGVQLNMEKAPTGLGIQIIEINPSAMPFDQVKTKLEAGVNDYLAKAKTAGGIAVIDAVKAKHAAIDAMEAEFKALAVKDDAAKTAFAERLFTEFMALKDALEAAAMFEAEASKAAVEAMSAANPMDLMDPANQAEIVKIMDPAKTVGEARKKSLEDGAAVLQYVYQDSTPLYHSLVSGGEPNGQATSEKTLKLYFGNMVDEWAK